MNNNTVYEWILHSTFTVAAREKSLESAMPYISPLVHQGDEVLDLCCGTGFVSFWLEGLGAKVTGVYFAPYMISLAEQEAILRDSTVMFIEADIFRQDFGQVRFDLVSCFDSISDFPISDFAKLGSRIANALKPGGRLVVKYVDGFYKHILEATLVKEYIKRRQNALLFASRNTLSPSAVSYRSSWCFH